MDKKNMNRRALTVFSLMGLVFIGFSVLLFFIQIANAGNYSSRNTMSRYDVSVNAPRGEILDCNGNALVYNEQVNTVTFNDLEFPREDKQINSVILQLISFLEGKGEKWRDDLPLVFDEQGKITYRENSDAAIKWMKSKDMLALNPYATAEDCMTVFSEKYALEDYSPEDARKIASVRYNMEKNFFSVSVPYTFADHISITSIAYIKENSDIFPGVDADVSSERKYIGNGSLAAHLLGIVGSINAEEYKAEKEKTEKALEAEGISDKDKEEIKNKSYALDDVIGKNGIEGSMEKYLRGTKGTKILTVDADKKITESFSVLPRSGGSVFLTINQNLQEIADSSLKKQVLEVTSEEALANGLYPAGAVIIQDIKTGAVLASSSYPNFSLSTYFDDYQSLAADPGKPLWNRAFQSTYSPGSTMKPVIAIAALEEGIIDPDTKVYCKGTYEYIDQVFACFNKTAHGNINVKQALEHSCNIFFFEMARQLGIEKMNTYSSLFGLGQKTGIEINESKGILAGIEYRDSIGQGWKAGETLLAAIGQSDNSFTPIQLSNYCSTIANGGTRYVPYLIEKVISSDYNTVLFKHEPEIAVETNVSETTLAAVKEGMYGVANFGACKYTLGDLKYKVACKTGTAEKKLVVDGKIVEGTDGFLIAFGPYENPEIAITVVIENAGSGSSTSQVAADIFEYYFANLNKIDTVQKDNSVIW